jgi:chromosome segregation protein
MLKRLELIGFKSFADRTRFDFAPGVTAIVGPNGSGKSNVVDAVRWLLGEQSAKSLRGGEMTDVIFNGSSTRKSLGLAEVTMTFDNAARALPLDADEVQVTRRVYRDGQGEYLINGQPSRLKDIRELFLGTGTGHGAYSVIEQGRVDALLSASTKDRRVIFEEAAGISRFKAKKVEALRKLAGVEEQLVRVQDVLTELDKQLRTLRLQAAKAQRYQEYTARLRDLRVAAGLAEYRSLSEALAAEEAVLAELRAELSAAAAEAEAGEADLRKLDRELGRIEDALRHQEARLADARQQIGACEAQAKAERGQAAGLEAELLRIGRQRADLGHRTRAAEAEAARVAGELDEVARQVDAERSRAEAAAAAVAAAAARIAELTRQAQADRELQFELVGRSAKLHGDAEAARAQADRLRRDLARRRAEAEQARVRHDALGRLLADLSQTDADLRQRLADARQALADHVAARDGLRQRADALQLDLEALREERSALRGRADVLEGLERGLEGFGAGVRAVLHRVRAGELSGAVLGLVADLLTAPRDVAPLIDLALGDAAQRFVVRDAVALDEVLNALGELPGRVGFVPLASGGGDPPEGQGEYAQGADAPRSPGEYAQGADAPRSPDGYAQGADAPRSLGEYAQGADAPRSPASASSVVHCDRPDLAHLPDQLLGRALIADDLAAARLLAPAHPGFRFVTRSGELLEPDGTVTIGPPLAEAGILSRKSELRHLRHQVADLDARIAAIEAEQADLRGRADALDAPVRDREAEIAALTGEAGSLRDQILEQRQVQRQLADALDLMAREAAIAEAEVAKADGACHEAERQAAEADREAEEVKGRLAGADAALSAAGRDRDERVRENTDAQVALSRVNERLAGLRKKRDELDAELRQRRIDGVNLSAADRSVRGRLLESMLAVLRAGAAAAAAYADKEARERQAAELAAQREALRAARERRQHELKESRDAWAGRRDQAHARELAARDLSNRRDALAQRIRDEYGAELAALAQGQGARGEGQGDESDPVPSPPAGGTDFGPPAPCPSPLAPSAEQEIADLRQKIAKLGSVNLEAVGELAEVERRAADLRAQFDDLTAGRAKLRQIIDQINADSRRLFAETLAAVRRHFQELFRKLFGGGMADVVLEDESDVLESGIEITARPPGKELQRISLLSGGERALTAVALLLAIFRSKPSPFCLLDEVDAAMDEANTVRLAGLLREFAERSQFVVVTHKKRTMAAADALYGVTMQESGVSKLVAVRFEDWLDEDDPPASRAA